MPDTDKIQERIDAIAKGMAAKGLAQANVDFYLHSHREHGVCLSWKAKTYSDGLEFFNGESEVSLAAAEAYVAALPSPEEARMSAFMSALSEAIELGKKVDVDADLVNPLLALMKRLSKNALQHKTTEAA